jgi:hypothetical protein
MEAGMEEAAAFSAIRTGVSISHQSWIVAAGEWRTANKKAERLPVRASAPQGPRGAAVDYCTVNVTAVEWLTPLAVAMAWTV